MVTVLEGKITDAEKKNQKLINLLLSLEIASSHNPETFAIMLDYRTFYGYKLRTDQISQ